MRRSPYRYESYFHGPIEYYYYERRHLAPLECCEGQRTMKSRSSRWPEQFAYPEGESPKEKPQSDPVSLSDSQDGSTSKESPTRTPADDSSGHVKAIKNQSKT